MPQLKAQVKQVNTKQLEILGIFLILKKKIIVNQ